MKLVSIQVALPEKIIFNNKEIITSIFKKAIAGPVMVNKLNIEGDKQADLRVHGGADKAVYAYSLDAYQNWNLLYGKNFTNGSLGENLTIDSFDEKLIGVGDIYQLGECKLQVVQPRVPCYKLGVRFNDIGAIKAFNKIQRSGIYFRVLEEGEIDIEQCFKLIEKEEIFVSIFDLYQVTIQSVEVEKLEKILKIKSLNVEWHDQITKELKKIK